MSDANELEILRRELAAEKQMRIEQARLIADLQRRLDQTGSAQESRLSGENDPESINFKLRRIQTDIGSPEAGGDDTLGGGDDGAGGGTSLSDKLKNIKDALCGATGTGTCNGDGTMTVTINLPGLSC